eukprot:TRINITY_DN27_c0_g2_i1.p1 TRINITY_DN27_c0_g2~~TRINITY_DN27_c0_g2_i1.p1  ORF type:complete len:573 (+),score=188.42 TRINITY_DN27_c0_g2_i1:33-1721(+)
MKLIFIVYFCIFSLIIINKVWFVTSSCAKYSGFPNECSSIVNYPFFVPEGLDVYDNITIPSYKRIFPLGTAISPCREAATRLICVSAYTQCMIYSLSSSLPNFMVIGLPRFPCRGYCEEAHEACADVPAVLQRLPACDSLHPSTNQSAYPVDGVFLNVSGILVFSPCFNLTNEDVLQPLSCPIGLTLHDDGYGDPPCTIPCPPPLLTQEERDVFVIVLNVLTTISFFCDIYLMLTLMLKKDRRSFPGHLPFFMVLANSIIMFSFVIVALVGHEAVWCVDSDELATQSHFLCGAQGTIFVLCTLWQASYMVLISLNLFLLIVIEIKVKTIKKFVLLYHAFALVFPTIFVIILLANKEIGYYGAHLCFIMNTNEHWQNAYLYWLLVLLVFQVLFCGISIIKLLVNSAISKKVRTQWSDLSSMGLFIVAFLFIFGVTLAIGIYNTENRDSYQTALSEYIACNAAFGTDCVQDPRPSFAATLIICLSIGASGLALTPSFGLKPESLELWKLAFLAIRRGDWNSILSGDLQPRTDHLPDLPRSARPNSIFGNRFGLSSALKQNHNPT